MMGERTVMQEALFYSFRIEDHVPEDHLLRSIDRFVDLTGIREHLKPFHSAMGRPSIDPELMIRMLIIGYCMGIRSERRLCEDARDLARDIAITDAYLVSRRQRKKVEMLFAHLKRILKLDRLRLRGPNGAKDEFHLAAAAQNLWKMAKIKPIPGLAMA